MKRYRRRGARMKKNEAHTVATITSRLDHELCENNPDNWHESADGTHLCIHGNVVSAR